MTKVTIDTLTLGKLQRWLEENPLADPKRIKEVKRLIRLAKDEEPE